MRLCVITGMIGILMGLAACEKASVETPDGRVEVEPADSFEIETDGTRVRVGDDRDGGRGNFCPPGHAKKGWC